MTPTQEMLERMLRKEESERLRVYDDATGKPVGKGDSLQGHPTIGVGRALDTQGITEAESTYLLLGDIDRVTGTAASAFGWFPLLSPERQTVILSMLFQLGLSGLQEFHKFLLAVQASNWEGAAAEMRASKWHKQTQSRAERLAKQMETGVFQP